jgi:hypothetical protein
MGRRSPRSVRSSRPTDVLCFGMTSESYSRRTRTRNGEALHVRRQGVELLRYDHGER